MMMMVVVVGIWNSLPTTVRSADSYDSFKVRLKTHLFDTVEERITSRTRAPDSEFLFIEIGTLKFYD